MPPPPTPIRNAPSSRARGMPVEEFLQSLTAQLDRAQDALAVKARSGRPLTWALKDLSIDLRVFMEVDERGRVTIRSAGPNEEGASTIHVNLTTITRPMMEENTFALHEDSDPRSITDLQNAAQLDDEERRRLDMMGIRTVGQLKRLNQDTSPKAVEAMVGIPIARMRAFMEASSRPTVSATDTVRRSDGSLLVRVHGANLHDGIDTEVRLGGEPVEILEAEPHQLLVRPLSHHAEGQVEVRTGGQRATGFYRLPEGVRRAPEPDEEVE